MHAYPAGGPTGADDNAFVAMCEQHRARLVAYCKRRLGTVHDAEDAAHEALVRALQAMPGFDHSTDAWPWLRTIAGRVCTDMQRRASRAATPGLVEVPVADDVHDQVAGRLRADILEDALDRLSPRYRSAIVLREFGGWSYDEIARAQGRSVPSVRSILTRGRKRLGTHVESVARSRGQWPLPGAVPPFRRLRERVRDCRCALERSGHTIMSVLELSTLATRWDVGANATAANILTFAAAAVAAVLPTPPADVARVPLEPHVAVAVAGVPPVAVAAPAPVTASVSADPARREVLTKIETTAPVPEEYAPGLHVGATTGVSSNKDMVWIRHTEEVTVPGVYSVSRSGGVSIPCTVDEARRVMCAVTRTAAERVDDL